MNLVLVTAPAAEPVTLAEAKEWLSVSHNLHDGMIGRLITAARIDCEKDTQRAFIRQKWRLTADEFETEGFVLPRPRLIEISSLTYYDADDEQQTFDLDDLWVDSNSEPARVQLATGSSWPTTSGRPGGVQIEYYAGYGEGSASVPDTARQAILHLVAYWYEHREAVITGTIVAVMPKTIQSMLDDHRIWHQW